MLRLSDLRLLLGVVLHPVRWWRAWRSVAAELLPRGGVTIDTPPGGPPPVLRTLIQPGGDVLVLVREGWEPDEAVVADHQDRVARWYADTAKVVEQGLGTLSALLAGVSLAAGGASGLRLVDELGAVAGLAAAAAIAAGVRLGLGRIASALLNRTIDRWLGRARGVA